MEIYFSISEAGKCNIKVPKDLVSAEGMPTACTQLCLFKIYSHSCTLVHVLGERSLSASFYRH